MGFTIRRSSSSKAIPAVEFIVAAALQKIFTLEYFETDAALHFSFTKISREFCGFDKNIWQKIWHRIGWLNKENINFCSEKKNGIKQIVCGDLYLNILNIFWETLLIWTVNLVFLGTKIDEFKFCSKILKIINFLLLKKIIVYKIIPKKCCFNYISHFTRLPGSH